MLNESLEKDQARYDSNDILTHLILVGVGTLTAGHNCKLSTLVTNNSCAIVLELGNEARRSLLGNHIVTPMCSHLTVKPFL